MTAEHEWFFSEKMPDEALFAELRKRGWQIGIEDKSVLHPKAVRIQDTPQSERNDVPVQEWLEINANLEAADDAYNREHFDDIGGYVLAAVWRLYLLLEPASVRAARLGEDDVVSAIAEEDE